MLVALNKGGTNEKISIRFRSNASWCGIDVCTHKRGGESRSKAGTVVCSEAVESIFQGEAVHNLWHCQIANMSCGLSAKGISCEKKGLIEKVFRGGGGRINF